MELFCFLALNSQSLLTLSHSVPGWMSFISATKFFSELRLSPLVLSSCSSYFLYLRR